MELTRYTADGLIVIGLCFATFAFAELGRVPLLLWLSAGSMFLAWRFAPLKKDKAE